MNRRVLKPIQNTGALLAQYRCQWKRKGDLGNKQKKINKFSSRDKEWVVGRSMKVLSVQEIQCHQKISKHPYTGDVLDQTSM